MSELGRYRERGEREERKFGREGRRGRKKESPAEREREEERY